MQDQFQESDMQKAIDKLTKAQRVARYDWMVEYVRQHQAGTTMAEAARAWHNENLVRVARAAFARRTKGQ